jgi:hypothetical protein
LKEQQQEELPIRQTKPASYAFMTLNSDETKSHYRKRLKLFFDHMGLPGDSVEQQSKAFLEKAKEEQEVKGSRSWVQEEILLFLEFHKQRVTDKKIAAGTLKTLYQPIKVFCEMHDDLAHAINTERITRGLPKARSYSNDRAPTLEEIRKLVKFSDHRLRAIVYVMCSSGIRSGAWDDLKWKHVTPEYDKKTGELVAAKLLVYARDGEEYRHYHKLGTKALYNCRCSC